MKQKNFNLYRKTSHIVLFGVSLTFTLMLFTEFGSEWHEKLLWGAMGFALEVIKLYLWMHLKSQWATQKAAALAQFVIYVGIAFVSMVASLGFAMNTIEGQSFTAQVQNLQIDSKMDELVFIESQIDTKIRQQSELPTDYVTASDRYTNQIADLREQRVALLEEIEAQQEEQAGRQTETMDTFTLIGRAVDMDGRDTLYYLMLIMVFALEICLVMTAGDIKRQVVVDENPRIFQYIEALFTESTSDKRLATDQAISEATGIPLGECHEYRQLLANMTYKKSDGARTPLIEIRQGGTKANFSRESISKIVRFHFHVQKKEA